MVLKRLALLQPHNGLDHKLVDTRGQWFLRKETRNV